MCGWLILFVYYNTCGRPYRPTEESSLVKKVYLKDELAQTEMEATASETTDDGQNRSVRRARNVEIPKILDTGSSPSRAGGPYTLEIFLENKENAGYWCIRF